MATHGGKVLYLDTTQGRYVIHADGGIERTDMYHPPSGQWTLVGLMFTGRGGGSVALSHITPQWVAEHAGELDRWTVLDLDHGSSGVIGSRAFHRDPKVVTVLAQSVIMGMRQADMQACGKHFPGHGFVKADSHLAVAVDKRSLRALRADDLQPFQWLSGQLGALMPAHVIYPKVDDQPAGFSRKWLQDILRDELGFTGAVFSDDLSMEGARAGGSAVQGAVKALQAGCDLVLFCNQSLGDGRALDGFMDGLGEALARGEWVGSEDSEARRLDLLPQRAPKVWDDLMHDAAYQVALERLAQV